MITRTMSPGMLRKEVQTNIFEDIVPYLKRNYDNKIRRYYQPSRTYILKTFVSIDLLRKDQVFAKLYSDMKEKKLLNYIVCLNDPESYLLKLCGSLLTSKL